MCTFEINGANVNTAADGTAVGCGGVLSTATSCTMSKSNHPVNVSSQYIIIPLMSYFINC